jgi:adenylate cyclase
MLIYTRLYVRPSRSPTLPALERYEREVRGKTKIHLTDRLIPGLGAECVMSQYLDVAEVAFQGTLHIDAACTCNAVHQLHSLYRAAHNVGHGEQHVGLLSERERVSEAATSGQVWAERYDRDLADIFAVQDEITVSVSAAILPAVGRSERERVARKPPDNLDAWECYQRGLWHVSKVEAAENALALLFFERAIELDPSFAAAHAAMSLALRAQAVIFRPQAERQTWLPRAMEHARRAVALDHADAFGHSSLAVALVHAGRHEEALAVAEIALSLDPNSSRAYYCQGLALAFGGRPREAIASLMMAMRLSPFDPFTPLFLNVLARAYYHIEDYPSAVASARQLCRSFPNFQNAYRTLIAALGQTGETAEAQGVMAEALQRFGADFRTLMAPLRTSVHEDRVETREVMRDGYRKAGVLDE